MNLIRTLITSLHKHPLRSALILFSAILLSVTVIIAYALLHSADAPPHGPAPQLGQHNIPAAIALNTQGEYRFTAPAYHHLQAVLNDVVDNTGLVDYQKLAVNHQDLDAWYNSIAWFDPDIFQQWNQQRQLAFWINAYNGLTLNITRYHYPIQSTLYGRLQNISQEIPDGSIRHIPGVWNGIEFMVMGKMLTLSHIEHQILRADFSEPRIHMAINCASMGCPPLAVKIYNGNQLEKQLENQCRRFLIKCTRTHIHINRTKSQVSLSPILKWFAEDFAHNATDDTIQKTNNNTIKIAVAEKAVVRFVSRYISTDDAEYLQNATYTLIYPAYDWSLNEQIP